MQELVNSGRSIDDPIIRRDWFGEFVFSNELTAFGYDRQKAVTMVIITWFGVI